MGQCMQYGLGSGLCDHFDADNPENNVILPSGCGENGECEVESDPCPGDNCDSFWGGTDVCDRTGDPFGDCECDDHFGFEECDDCGEDATECDCTGEGW
jgi:hypothetical protein